MVRGVVADETLSNYFPQLAKQNTFSIGLILGQSCSGRDYIIHFAKTPPSETSKRLLSLSDVNEEWVCDHARQTTRMLPGGMCVLGIFIISVDEVLSSAAAKVKSLLNRINKHLALSTFLYGNSNVNERLVLNFVTSTHQFICKSIEVASGSVKPADFKFLPNGIKWVQIGCHYQMGQVYFIDNLENDWPLRKHMKIILNNLNKNLQSSVYFFDGELRDCDESIENIGKKKVSRGSKTVQTENLAKPVDVTILQQCSGMSGSNSGENGSQIKIFGQVASKLWLHPKCTITNAIEAIREDIMRSLSTRFEMHWDSLTEEEHSEDLNSIHEPPRRVLINLPNSNVAISDYLFPGEGSSDVKVSLEELLDFKLKGDEAIDEAEGQADLSEYYTEEAESGSDEMLVATYDGNRTLYLIGLGVAFLVLIVSLLIHFFQ